MWIEIPLVKDVEVKKFKEDKFNPFIIQINILLCCKNANFHAKHIASILRKRDM